MEAAELSWAGRLSRCLALAILIASVALAASTALAQAAGPSPTPAAPQAAPPATTPAPAPAAQPAAPKPLSGTEAWIKKTKEPATWWKWGADLRLRNEYMDNTLTLSSAADRHEQNYQRVRGRWWNVFTPVKNVDLNLRLTFESRNWGLTSYSAPFHTGWDWNEAVFDYANVKIKNLLGAPLTLQVGRQDLMIGEGFLVFEGTPLDGSRTIYFDAARATYELKAKKTTIDVIFIDQFARNDHYLPPIRLVTESKVDSVSGAKVELPIKKAQVEHDEKGLIFYLSNKQRPKTNVDLYYIYKQSRKDLSSKPEDNAALLKTLAGGDDADLHTAGTRLSGDLSRGWRYRLEAALQAGKKNTRTVRATAFNSALTYAPKSKLSHQLRLQYEYMSGDRITQVTPGQYDLGRDEQFDPLWGRWPRWSELYIYTFAPEVRISQISNLHRVGPGYTFKPTKNSEFITDYYLLYASKNNRLAPAGFFSTSGKKRGSLLTTILKHRFGQHLNAHVWGEYLFPGNYYGEARRDTAVFLRAETIWTW